MAVKKGKKGAKGKKNAKGKKDAKGKKKAVKKIKEKPMIPEKTFAKVHRFKFANEDNFLGYLCEMDLNLPIYVLFRSGHLLHENDMIEEQILKFIYYMQQDPDSTDIIFVTVTIDPEKLESSPLALFPKTRLERLPSLLRWGRPWKLDGLQRCSNLDLLCLLFADNRKCPPIDFTSFTDDNKNLCPFLPTPEEMANPPPTPPPEVPKALPPKKKKKGKKRGKSKGAKGKKRGKKEKNK